MSEEIKEEKEKINNDSSFFWTVILMALIFGFGNQTWNRNDEIKGEYKDD